VGGELGSKLGSTLGFKVGDEDGIELGDMDSVGNDVELSVSQSGSQLG